MYHPSHLKLALVPIGRARHTKLSPRPVVTDDEIWNRRAVLSRFAPFLVGKPAETAGSGGTSSDLHLRPTADTWDVLRMSAARPPPQHPSGGTCVGWERSLTECARRVSRHAPSAPQDIYPPTECGGGLAADILFLPMRPLGRLFASPLPHFPRRAHRRPIRRGPGGLRTRTCPAFSPRNSTTQTTRAHPPPKTRPRMPSARRSPPPARYYLHDPPSASMTRPHKKAAREPESPPAAPGRPRSLMVRPYAPRA